MRFAPQKRKPDNERWADPYRDNRSALMLSDEGVAMLGMRRHHQLDRTGTIVGLKDDCYVVHWDGNATETVKRYARLYIKIIQSAPKAPLG